MTNTCHTCKMASKNFFVLVRVLFFLYNGFSVVSTLLHFVVSIKSPLAVSCYCNNFEYQGLSSIIVSFGNIVSLHLEGQHLPVFVVRSNGLLHALECIIGNKGNMMGNSLVCLEIEYKRNRS